MVNKFQPHILVLPEDDANRQIANGFFLRNPDANRRVQILPVAGGWAHVLESFKSDHLRYMEKYPERMMVLLIDFDGRLERLETARSIIPEHLAHRVFVLGALNEPEDLKRDLGDFETIGLGLAKDCEDEADTLWGHELIQHNMQELQRLRDAAQPILFQRRQGNR